MVTANSTPTAHPRLTPSEVARFRTEGYLLPETPVFSDADFAKLKGTFESILDNLETDIRPEAMDVPHFQHPELFEWLYSDSVLDLVEPILGPDLALFSSHFICKPTGNGKRVPWHEDSAYWRGMIDPMEVVTVWLAIDPSTTVNGCMNVIPRSHNTGKMGFSDYDELTPNVAVFNTEIKAAQRDDSKAIAVELQPNFCSLHDGRIIHGSAPNNSSIRRCGYTMRYISTATKLSEKASQYHQIYLARGRNLSGGHFADPTKAYPELARFRAKHGKNGH